MVTYHRAARMLAISCGLLAFSTAPAAWAGITGEAIAGRPFGVARITLDIPPGDSGPTRGFATIEAAGRAHYPAYQAAGIGEKLGEIADIGGGILGKDRPLLKLLGRIGTEIPPTVSVFVLFTGDEPLKVTVYTPTAHTITLVPRPLPAPLHDRLLRTWWREYNANAKAQSEASDYPPLVETYLTAMLGRRLGLDPIVAPQKKTSEPQETLELVFGVESLRAKTMRETMARTDLPASADQPVPDDVVWTPQASPEPGEETDIEPMAMHVPEECFYVRFGTFNNFVWMNHLTDEYAGDMTRMVTLRGHQDDSDLRQQKQLSLKESKIGDLVGGTLISDVALIGRDTFTREGGAVGVIFQARNALLGSQFRQERTETLAEEKASGATMETVKIGGRDVSFLSTPDNRIRSYYAVDGDFHFFTTSKAMVERFFAAGAGKGALGKSREFHQARALMPLKREDTIFVYFSSAFFRGFVSPQYQIELARRIQSVTDMELVQLAQLAAKGEGLPSETLEDLMAGGFLPRGFGRRPDGSGPVLERDTVIDSMRGPRGTFTPIPDVVIKAVTREEAERYTSRATFYREQWKQMDPLMVGIKRYALDRKGGEKIVVDAFVAPFVEQKYGTMLSILGPPNNNRITPAPGDLVNVQAFLAGGTLAPLIPPHFLFLGLQDSDSLGAGPKGDGMMQTLQMLQSAPGYLGAWPKAGFLDWLPLGLLGSAPDPLGFSKYPLGIWRRQWEGFSALSFDRELLAGVSPNLRSEEVETAAQLRVQVKDLTGTKLSGWVNDTYYDRAFKTSAGNTRLLLAMTDQLHVPSEVALETAEKLLDVKLACALGGKYQPVREKSGAVYWESTKWPGVAAKEGAAKEGDRGPDEFQAPLLSWFRGLDGYLTKDGDKMVAHLELDMQRHEPETKVELPLFKLFGGAKDPKKEEPKKDEPKKPAAKPVPAEVLPAPAKPAPKKPREF